MWQAALWLEEKQLWVPGTKINLYKTGGQNSVVELTASLTKYNHQKRIDWWSFTSTSYLSSNGISGQDGGTPTGAHVLVSSSVPTRVLCSWHFSSSPSFIAAPLWGLELAALAPQVPYSTRTAPSWVIRLNSGVLQCHPYNGQTWYCKHSIQVT